MALIDRLRKLGRFNRHFLFPGKYLGLNSMMINCGYFQEEKDYYWDGLKRGGDEFIIWQYTVSGLGRLHYEGRDYPVEPGSAFLVHIPHVHKYFLPSGTSHWEYLYVCIEGCDALALGKHIERNAGPVMQFGEDSRTITSMLNILRPALANQITSPYQNSELAYAFMMSLAQDASPLMVRESGENDFIKPVVDFCLEHLAEPIDIGKLSKLAGYSRFHFIRLFKRSQKVSPGAFILQLRLKQAVSMLKTEHKTVKEIAYECGFNNPSYFSRMFVRAYGCTPNEFRSASHRTSHAMQGIPSAV